MPTKRSPWQIRDPDIEAAQASALGSALTRALASAGMSQTELARRLSTSQSTVSAYCNGIAAPEHRTIYEIERALELAPGQLSRHVGCLPLRNPSGDVPLRDQIAHAPDDLLNPRAKELVLMAFDTGHDLTVREAASNKRRARRNAAV